MDILNFISWIKGRRQVTSVDPTRTLLPVGLKDGRRDDEYLAGAISVQDFINQVGTGSTGAQGPMGPQGVPGPVGPAGLFWQGLWSSATIYVENDAVSFGGASYFCYNPAGVGPSLLDPVTDTANWALLAAEGATGPQGPQGIQGPAAFTRYIGEPYQGGIIVDLWKDTFGIEHGLIMSYINIPIKVWSNVAIVGATSVTDGLANSNTIVAQAGHTTSMALDCLNYTNINYGTGVYTDWYLPSIGEMMCVVKNRVIIDSAIAALGGAVGLLGAQYWTSTSTGISSAMISSQATLILGSINKTNPQPGRPFRKF